MRHSVRMRHSWDVEDAIRQAKPSGCLSDMAQTPAISPGELRTPEDDELHQQLQLSRQQEHQAIREADALRVALRAQDKLSKHPQAGDVTGAPLKVAELEVALRFAREELRLERGMLASVRHQASSHHPPDEVPFRMYNELSALSQVETAEAAREAGSAQLQRLLRPEEAVGVDVPAAATWDTLREQRVVALERGLAARDVEVAALRNAADQARMQAAQLAQSNADEQAQVAAGVDRLRAELAAVQASSAFSSPSALLPARSNHGPAAVAR